MDIKSPDMSRCLANLSLLPQVSMDDDLEGLFLCLPCVPEQCQSDVHLAKLPPGALEMVVKDAQQRMAKCGAFLWSLNVSDNPFYMCHGVSQKNGLCALD